MADGSRGIQSVEVSGRILRALAARGAPMMLRDLALAVGLAPAQCHAYLTSLRQTDLVRQDPATGLYRAGPLALRLGLAWLRSTALASAVIRETGVLSADLGLHSQVAVWGMAGPTIVHIHEGVTQTALNLRPGSLYSVTGTATGRVFAAFGTAPGIEAQIEAEIGQSGSATGIGDVMKREEFTRQLDATRRQGYSTAEGTPIPGINAVAAPVFEGDGMLWFVVTLVGPSDELPVGESDVAVGRLLASARMLSGGEAALGPVLPDSGAGVPPGRPRERDG